MPRRQSSFENNEANSLQEMLSAVHKSVKNTYSDVFGRIKRRRSESVAIPAPPDATNAIILGVLESARKARDEEIQTKALASFNRDEQIERAAEVDYQQLARQEAAGLARFMVRRSA